MGKQPISLSEKFPQKRAFVTGAGSGLGLTFALALAKDGWSIGLTDINKARLDAAVSAVDSAGGKATGYVFDVADNVKFKSAVDAFSKKNDGIDLGINNAGIGCGGLFDEVSIDTFHKVIETNLMGVANGCHLFVPIMKKQGHGHILNVASAAAFATAPRMSAYSVSKAGVVALSECLKAELAGSNVSVSVLCPSYARTNIGNDSIGAETDRAFSRLLVNEAGLSAEQVVGSAFKGMEEGKLYIVLPNDVRFLWRYKRLMPEQYWRVIKSATDKKVGQLEAKIKSRSSKS